MVMFLATPGAESTTGAIIDVNGAYYLRTWIWGSGRLVQRVMGGSSPSELRGGGGYTWP